MYLLAPPRQCSYSQVDQGKWEIMRGQWDVLGEDIRFWRRRAQKIMERRSECILGFFLAPLWTYISFVGQTGSQ